MSDTENTRKDPKHPPTQASVARRAYHAVVAIAGWVLFIYWWSLVLGRVRPGEVRFTGLFLLISIVAIFAITAVWVLHNRAIYRRKGARTRVREAKLDYSRDPLGRLVVFEGSTDGMQQAPVVHVHIDGDRKTYKPVRTVSSKTAA